MYIYKIPLRHPLSYHCPNVNIIIIDVYCHNRNGVMKREFVVLWRVKAFSLLALSYSCCTPQNDVMKHLYI